MLSIYKIIINIIFFFAPIILRIRVLKNKEHKTRFKEKLCYFTKSKPSGKLIWFHASSVGEVLSIIPLIEKIEKLKSIKTILVNLISINYPKIQIQM